MSFSSDIKKELNNNSSLTNKELVKYELMGYLISKNTLVDGRNIKYSTESDYNINRFSRLLANLDIEHNIEILGKTFIITLNANDADFVTKSSDLINTSAADLISKGEIYLNAETKDMINQAEKNKNQTEEKLKAIIRGSFLRFWFC